MKSTVAEIRERFDNDVERFSNLETGQTATIDAALVLDLVTKAAATVTPSAKAVLDIGCGAGNYTLKMLQAIPNLDCTLLDLSAPMLERAVERVTVSTSGTVTSIQGDVREVAFGDGVVDVVLAAAVLHHLRDESQWHAVCRKLYTALRPGGSIWIADLIEHTTPAVQSMMWECYGEYLTNLKGPEYRDQVFAYIEKEDTAQSLMFQIDALRAAGFREVELLHKNSCFAAFGAIK